MKEGINFKNILVGIVRITAIITVIAFAFTACPGDGGSGGGSQTTSSCNAHNWGWATYTSGSGLRECRNSGCTVTAGVGDRGPAGGVIFIARAISITLLADSPLSDKQVNYYEAWTVNETASIWGDSGTQISGLSGGGLPPTALGSGLRDTQRIVANMAGKSITDTAAQRARAVSGTGTTPGTRGGYNDWFLPDFAELNELWKLWDSKGRGSYENLSTGNYISSSQVGLTGAWALTFSTGYRGDLSKNTAANVRAVRAF